MTLPVACICSHKAPLACGTACPLPSWGVHGLHLTAIQRVITQERTRRSTAWKLPLRVRNIDTACLVQFPSRAAGTGGACGGTPRLGHGPHQRVPGGFRRSQLHETPVVLQMPLIMHACSTCSRLCDACIPARAKHGQQVLL